MSIKTMSCGELEKTKPIIHRNRWTWGRSHVIVILGGRGMVTVQVDNDFREYGTIAGLSVVPKLRKKGLGKHLLDLAEQECRKMGCTKARLFSGTSGFTCEWYERCGYVKRPDKRFQLEWDGSVRFCSTFRERSIIPESRKPKIHFRRNSEVDFPIIDF